MCAQEAQPCGSIESCLRILGDKWTSLIIRDLTTGPRRFTELEQALHIGPRTLSQRLDSLAAEEVITKKQYAEAPPRVEYALTAKGEDLLPILQTMANWAQKYPNSTLTVPRSADYTNVNSHSI
ncbi:MAG TPA: helix-turn-helix domain-containing protein [Patescibacteria group bacterium]|nr:helix-turn-helix domain-containing protein [Patescibacteria group bacterium]